MNTSRIKLLQRPGLLTLMVLALFMFLSFRLAFAGNLHRLPALNSPAYVEEIARQQLGMVFEGDRIFIESIE